MSEKLEKNKNQKKKRFRYKVDQEFKNGFQNNFYYISQVLDQRILPNGRTQCYVSWEGWPSVFNSWVYTDTVMPVDQMFRNIESTMPSHCSDSYENDCKIVQGKQSQKKNSQLFEEETYADQDVKVKQLVPRINLKLKINKNINSKPKLKSKKSKSQKSTKKLQKNIIKKNKLNKIRQIQEQNERLAKYFQSIQLQTQKKYQQSQNNLNLSALSSQSEEYPALKKNQQEDIQQNSINLCKSNEKFHKSLAKKAKNEQILIIEDSIQQSKAKKAQNKRKQLKNQLMINLADTSDFQLSRISIDQDFSNNLPIKTKLLKQFKNPQKNQNTTSIFKKDQLQNKFSNNKQCSKDGNNQKQKVLRQTQKQSILKAHLTQQQNIQCRQTGIQQKSAEIILKQSQVIPINQQKIEKRKKICLSSLFKGPIQRKADQINNKNIEKTSQTTNLTQNKQIDQTLLLPDYSTSKVFQAPLKNVQESLLIKSPIQDTLQKAQKFPQSREQQTNLLNNTEEEKQNKIHQAKKQIINNNTLQYSLLLSQSLLQNPNINTAVLQNINHSNYKSEQIQQSSDEGQDNNISQNNQQNILQQRNNSQQFSSNGTSQNKQAQQNTKQEQEVEEPISQSEYNQILNNYYRRVYPQIYQKNLQNINMRQEQDEKQKTKKGDLNQQPNLTPQTNNKQFKYDFKKSYPKQLQKSQKIPFDYNNDKSKEINNFQFADDDSQTSIESSSDSDHELKTKIIQLFSGNFDSKDSIHNKINNTKKNPQSHQKQTTKAVIETPENKQVMKHGQQKQKRKQMQNIKNILHNSNIIQNSNAVLLQKMTSKNKQMPQINDEVKRNSNQAMKQKTKKKCYPVHNIRLLKQ